MVKQWDATLDGDTRPTHRALDGQIRETDKPFESSSGRTARYPGDFGDPAEDCNCRCVALTRARWELDASELQTLKDRAKFFRLDKTDSFKDFEKKYLKAAQTVEKSGKSGIIGLSLQQFANNVEKDLQRQKTSSIRKSLETFDQRIAEHQQKIQHPEQFVPDWTERDIREQEGLKKHWEKRSGELQEIPYAKGRRIETAR